MMRQMDEPARFMRLAKIEETGQDKHRLIGNPLRWMDILLSGMRYYVMEEDRAQLMHEPRNGKIRENGDQGAL